LSKSPSPVLNVQRFHSQGDSFRWLDPRNVMQTAFSKIERAAVLFLEFDETVVALKTQKLLYPIAELSEIAEELGVPKPRLSQRSPSLSIDIVATVLCDESKVEVALPCKPASRVKQERASELLAIQRVYCERREIRFRVITELDVPPNRVRNLRMASACCAALHSMFDEGERLRLHHLLLASIARDSKRPLFRAGAEIDRAGARPGVGMTVFWAGVWEHRIRTNLDKRFLTMEPCETAECA
jgi:hypothetical protein